MLLLEFFSLTFKKLQLPLTMHNGIIFIGVKAEQTMIYGLTKLNLELDYLFL